MKIRDAIMKQVKESTSLKMGGAECEDAEMPSAGLEVPPPPQALVTGEMMAAVTKVPTEPSATPEGLFSAGTWRRSWERMDFEFADIQGHD